MTIEDRSAGSWPTPSPTSHHPHGVPLEVARRRRRRRPVLVGAAALLLVLAAVVSLVAVRERQRPLPTTDPTRGLDRLH
jgi:hypothetical protein